LGGQTITVTWDTHCAEAKALECEREIGVRRCCGYVRDEANGVQLQNIRMHQIYLRILNMLARDRTLLLHSTNFAVW